jgi:hypothetical protein
VRILQEGDLGDVRYRYQVTDCYSEAGCLEVVVLSRVGRRWRQEVEQRLSLEELERALAEPMARPVLSWGVYEEAFRLLKYGPWPTAERDYARVIVLARGEFGTGCAWQFRLRLDRRNGPLFERVVLKVDEHGVEWERMGNRWTPPEMLAYLLVPPPRGSAIDREAGLEALAQLQAIGAWGSPLLSAEELAKLLKAARRFRAARPLLS